MKAVIITGAHRSGTSAVAGMLAAATGIQFGSVNRQYLADNPRGNYENPAVVDLNDLMIGGDWKHPKQPTGTRWAQHIDALLEREFPYPADTWIGMKDPRFCFTGDTWSKHLDASFIVVQRDIQAVIASMVAREKAIYGRDMDEGEAFDIAGLYEGATAKLPNPEDTWHCWFPDADLPDYLGSICEQMGIPYAAAKARAFYSEKLVHQR